MIAVGSVKVSKVSKYSMLITRIRKTVRAKVLLSNNIEAATFISHYSSFSTNREPDAAMIKYNLYVSVF